MVESRVGQIIEGAITDLGFHLVRVQFQARRWPCTIADHGRTTDDRDMTVEDCEAISRHIAALLDVEDPIGDAYVLEVSSPGIDRPLTRIEDYTRFNGELAKITLRLMLDGRRRFNGRRAGCGWQDHSGNQLWQICFCL